MATQISCVNIVESLEKFLFVKEGGDKERRFNLPGGKLKYRESLVDCAKREGREETGGLELEPQYIVGIYQRPTSFEKNNTTFIVFYSDIVSGKISRTKEHPEIKFFDYEQIKELEKKGRLRSRYIIPAIDDYLKGKKIDLEHLKSIA